MTTTHLFVELLVIGFGACAWLALLALALLGYPKPEVTEQLFSLQALFPLLSIAYVLGILIDRLADWLTDSHDKNHRDKVFNGDEETYFDARRTLVVDGPALWTHIEYGRSRLRICRGWMINTVLIALSLDAFVLARQPAISNLPCKLTLLNLFLVGLAVLCAACWSKLNYKEYEKVERQAEWLRDRKRATVSTAQEIDDPDLTDPDLTNSNLGATETGNE